MEIDQDKIKKVYIIGIKGSGAVSFAEIFHAQKKEVTGSDTEETFFTDEILKGLGIKFYEGFDEQNIKKEEPIDLVVYSSAYNAENNPELKYAKDNDLPMLSYPELIGLFIKNNFGIAVCGTHGKTTTTAMLALSMREAGADPTAVIGSKVRQLKSNVLVGKSKYFVVEADEYQNKLALYDPIGVVLTSVDYDHPDFFPTEEEYFEVFRKFVKRIPKHGFLVAWGEDANVVKIAKLAQCKIILYGSFSDDQLMYNLKNEFQGMNVEFEKTPENLNLNIPGRHNIINATAAFAAAKYLKMDQQKVLTALNEFRGTSRRFELMGESNGAVLIDDYAHHPVEIKATLGAIKEKYPARKIICVFHPHTFSRTKALLDEFSQSFDEADEVIVLDIYGSAREKEGTVHSRDLVEKIEKFQDNVTHIPTIEECFAYLKDKIDEHDVVVTMGAGNVWELCTMLNSGTIV